MSRIQTELEQSFRKYQCVLVMWNQAISDVHDAEKLPDSLQNRITLQTKNTTLGIKYDEYKKSLKKLQEKILKKHNCKPSWNENRVKESD